jgi:hypothetical protein
MMQGNQEKFGGMGKRFLEIEATYQTKRVKAV